MSSSRDSSRMSSAGTKEAPLEHAAPYKVALTARSLAYTVLGAMAVAYTSGTFCRKILTDSHSVKVESNLARRGESSLPSPVLLKGKAMPDFIYTARHFGAGATAANDLLLSRGDLTGIAEDLSAGIFVETNSTSAKQESSEELHEPSGQHLLVDLENVDEEFLNSQERLARAMVNLIDLSGLTMLSYHCHGLEPTGVSCVGVLLESHVSFHTWPIQGVITLDLFTCGTMSLLPLLSVIDGLFGIPREPSVDDGVVDQPRMQWAHKKRGFPFASNPNDATTLDHHLLGWMEYDLKEQVASVETEMQSIAVYDVINPRFRSGEQYRKSLRDDGSYESEHPKIFMPDRMLFLNNVLQSRRYGEAAYYEALVHPAMLTALRPRNVAIIGGGEGAILREVLKHKMVEHVTMIEPDELFVNASRAILPEWSDCSDLIGSDAESCFDDPRVKLVIADPETYFEQKAPRDAGEGCFDVVIIDTRSLSPFSSAWYTNEAFILSLHATTHDQTVLVVHVGESERLMDAPREYSATATEQHLLSIIRQHELFGFAKEYSEAHGGLNKPARFLIVFRDQNQRPRWYLEEAEINRELHSRVVKTVDGSWPLRFFDGASMMTYQYPSRVTEEIFCRSSPRPALCERGHGFDPKIQNAPISSFEVRPSRIPTTDRGVFFTEAFPSGTYVAVEEEIHDLLIRQTTTSLVKKFVDAEPTGRWKVFEYYIFGYGVPIDIFGDVSYYLDASIMTFINQGCNNTNIMGTHSSLTERTSDHDSMPSGLSFHSFEAAMYNPFLDRNHFIAMNRLDELLEDVVPGTELLDNLMGYLNVESRKEGILDYRSQCLSQEVGVITSYETAET